MILSVSRRTDIPNYYMDWFLARLEEGEVCVKNPWNPRQISQIALNKETIDCIVFWTKHPKGLLHHLNELKEYPYYIQFTLTGYGRDLEPMLPDKRTILIPEFQYLAKQLGKEKVVWRYDPILINHRYTVAYHCKAFAEIAASLEGSTTRVVISFLDLYRKMKARENKEDHFREVTREEMCYLGGEFAKIAKAHHMTIQTCSEEILLEELGVSHGCCIDKKIVEDIIGVPIKSLKKDTNQRANCGCIQSIDIGTYDTCPCGCTYCYATDSKFHVEEHLRAYDVNSKLLCDKITLKDKVSIRKVSSLKVTN